MYLISDVLKWEKDCYGWSINPKDNSVKIKIGNYQKGEYNDEVEKTLIFCF